MEFLKKQVMRLSNLFDHTDEKVEAIYKKPLSEVDKLNKSVKKVNRLMYNKDVSYYIGKATGSIQNG